MADPKRGGTEKEVQTQGRIRSELARFDSGVASRLLPTITREVSTIAQSAKYTEARRRLASGQHLGSQYEWLASFAENEGIELELSIHKDDKAHAVMRGHTVTDRDGVHRVRPDAPSDVVTLFGQFAFGLFDTTKLEMLEAARDAGFAPLMEMTWFCHTPLFDGRPCGFCPPCTYTREEGLGRRVPPPTLRRRVHYDGFRAVRRLRKAISPRR
ncbi:hypothetical protein OVA21_03875 [Dietzia sp. SL131]|uniref:hypothetical protein n=1 Tax=Dietzia sp. SL131 TaxID=2995149 RepID=UPI00227C651A|nr:hypothetical protein [Dietzia sp. SL131]MCY1656359.1 hypothetical protein [Dietzia sp. SL131]